MIFNDSQASTRQIQQCSRPIQHYICAKTTTTTTTRQLNLPSGADANTSTHPREHVFGFLPIPRFPQFAQASPQVRCRGYCIRVPAAQLGVGHSQGAAEAASHRQQGNKRRGVVNDSKLMYSRVVHFRRRERKGEKCTMHSSVTADRPLLFSFSLLHVSMLPVSRPL